MSCVFESAQREKEEKQSETPQTEQAAFCFLSLSLSAVILSFPLTQMNDPPDMIL